MDDERVGLCWRDGDGALSNESIQNEAGLDFSDKGVVAIAVTPTETPPPLSSSSVSLAASTDKWPSSDYSQIIKYAQYSLNPLQLSQSILIYFKAKVLSFQ